MGQTLSNRRFVQQGMKMAEKTFKFDRHSYKQFTTLDVKFDDTPLLFYKAYAARLYGYLVVFLKDYFPDKTVTLAEFKIIDKMTEVMIEYMKLEAKLKN